MSITDYSLLTLVDSSEPDGALALITYVNCIMKFC